jgi:hypothetical protein
VRIWATVTTLNNHKGGLYQRIEYRRGDTNLSVSKRIADKILSAVKETESRLSDLSSELRSELDSELPSPD